MIKYSKKNNVKHVYMEIAAGAVVDEEGGDIINFYFVFVAISNS